MIDLNKNKNANNSNNVNTNTNPIFFSVDAYSKEATTASVFSKEGLFSFAGRRGRLKYFLVNFILSIVGEALSAIFKGSGVFLFVIGILVFFIQSTNIAKRMHDVEMSGKYALILFAVLFVSSIVSKTLLGMALIVEVVFSLYLLFKKGTAGSNKYGPDPLR